MSEKTTKRTMPREVENLTVKKMLRVVDDQGRTAATLSAEGLVLFDEQGHKRTFLQKEGIAFYSDTDKSHVIINRSHDGGDRCIEVSFFDELGTAVSVHMLKWDGSVRTAILPK